MGPAAHAATLETSHVDRLARGFTDPVDAWLPLTHALNAVNFSMGDDDRYPFILSPGRRQARPGPRPRRKRVTHLTGDAAASCVNPNDPDSRPVRSGDTATSVPWLQQGTRLRAAWWLHDSGFNPVAPSATPCGRSPRGTKVSATLDRSNRPPRIGLLVERDVMVGAYAVRKLNEARMLSNNLTVQRFEIVRFDRDGAVPDHFNREFWESFKLLNPSQ